MASIESTCFDSFQDHPCNQKNKRPDDHDLEGDEIVCGFTVGANYSRQYAEGWKINSFFRQKSVKKETKSGSARCKKEIIDDRLHWTFTVSMPK